MRDTVTPISRRQAAEHARITEELEDLCRDLIVLRSETAAGMLLVLARRIMADTARLVSREPGTRGMKRLPLGSSLPANLVRDTIRDAQLALKVFERAHGLVDEDTGDIIWLTHEQMREWDGDTAHPASP